MRLTDLAVKNLAVEAGQKMFLDDTMPGFGVRVSPTSKTFVLITRKRGRTKWETLGKYPIVTLAAAREEAKNRLSATQLRKGPEIVDMRFEDAFATFMVGYRAKNRQKTVYEMERLVNRHLMPKLKGAFIADISTHELATIIERLLPTPSECLALFKASRTLFRRLARRRLIERSPLQGVEPPVKPENRTRVLTDAELRSVWMTAIAQGNLNPEFARIVRLLILTGQRESQIAKVHGEWIKRDTQRVEWPAEAMKNNRPHVLPLAPMALAIAGKLAKEGYVFKARGKETPFNGFSACKAAFDERAKIAAWTLHDLRRTFSTGIARLGVAPHIKEMILAHSSAKDPVEAIYDLHTYENEMRGALERWEMHLQSIICEAQPLMAEHDEAP